MQRYTSAAVAIDACGLPPPASAMCSARATPAADCVISYDRRLVGLAASDQRLLVPSQAHDDFPSLGDFIASAGRSVIRPGNRAQGYQLLDRLMGGAVFADADGTW